MPARKTTVADPRRVKTRQSQPHSLRNKLVRKLPAMLDAAIAAYQQIAFTAPADDPKSFAAAHTGAKAALSHIEQIIKLAESAIEREAQANAVNVDQTDQIETLLKAARSALGVDPEAQENQPSEPTDG